MNPIAWIADHEALLWSLTIVSIVMFVATLIAMPLVIARLPADYFTRRAPRGTGGRRPVLHLFLAILRNGFGFALLLVGLAMLVLPGQGLLAILVAIMLLDFPGKRRLERWLIRRAAIFRAVNWIRAKRRRPPLEMPNRPTRDR